jgi:hypothetical protein
VETALYILLGVLVVGVVGLQVWIARSSRLAGSRSGAVLAIRLFNMVLLMAAIALAVYALANWQVK